MLRDVLDPEIQISCSFLGCGMYIWNAAYSRGHLAPLWGHENDEEMNFLPTNISPQEETLNNKNWYISWHLVFLLGVLVLQIYNLPSFG